MKVSILVSYYAKHGELMVRYDSSSQNNRTAAMQGREISDSYTNYHRCMLFYRSQRVVDQKVILEVLMMMNTTDDANYNARPCEGPAE
jgi:hypothetical protein